MQGNPQGPLAAVEYLGRIVSTLLMLAMMGVTVADVLGRRFGFSFAAAFEVTQLLVALTFYMILPQATARRAHIIVDLIPQRDDRIGGLLMAALVDLLSAFAIGWAAAMLFRQASTLELFNTLLMFTRMPLSPFVTIMAVMATLTALICLVQAGLRLRALIALWRVA
ncbi:MAG: TRAP transporter small permease [Pararhodobacter sp.]